MSVSPQGPATRTAPARRGSFSALRNRDFAIFWTGAFATNATSWFQSLGVPFVLLMLTGSALWVGLAAAAQFVPVMLLGPLGGQIASAGRLRRTLLVTQGLRAVVGLAMFVCWAAGVREPLAFLLLMVAVGVAQGLSMPAWQAFIYELSDRRTLMSAVALNSLQFNLSRSFGPALGGLVLLLWGPSVAFLVAFLGMMCVLSALLLVRQGRGERKQDEAERRARPGVLRGFLEAARYSAAQPGIMLGLLLTVSIGVLGMPVFQHAIVFSELVFHSGEVGLTLLNLGLGVGTVAAAPFLGGFQASHGQAQLVRVSLPLYGMALMGFALAPGTVTATLALVVVGATFLAGSTVAAASIQMLLHAEFRGRVLALNVMCYTGSVAFGAYVQGWLSDAIGPRLTPFLAGVAMLVLWLVLSCWRGRYALSALDGKPGPASHTTA